MNSKLDFFNALKLRFQQEAPEIKTFRVFNNQFANERTEKPFPFPAVMLEFRNLTYTSKSDSLQEADATVLLHVAFASLKTEDEEIFKIVHKVNQTAQAFRVSGLCSSLSRQSEKQDVDHDGLIVWEIEYRTLLTDNTASRKRRLVKVTTDLGLEIEKDASAPFLKVSE